MGLCSGKLERCSAKHTVPGPLASSSQLEVNQTRAALQVYPFPLCRCEPEVAGKSDLGEGSGIKRCLKRKDIEVCRVVLSAQAVVQRKTQKQMGQSSAG